MKVEDFSLILLKLGLRTPKPSLSNIPNFKRLIYGIICLKLGIRPMFKKWILN